MFHLRLCLCATSVQCPQKLEKDVRSPGTRVIDKCELPHGCWGWNQGPVKPSFQPHICIFFKIMYVHVFVCKYCALTLGAEGARGFRSPSTGGAGSL